MDQPTTHHKPRFEVIEPSMVRAQFTTKRDTSSFLQQNHKHRHQQQNHDQIQLRTAEETDQISIFDAAKYFNGLHDDNNRRSSLTQQASSPKVILELASMARISSVSSSIDNQSNYRARSFHATPTSSSEASWNSQTGLLSNPPGSLGITIHHKFSPSSTTTTTAITNNNSRSISYPKWQRINPKWLIPSRKCPCSGKKSVQVDERIDSKTPRMVDLRSSYSTNCSNASSYYSSRHKSPQKSTSTTISLPILPQVQDPNNNANFGLNLITPRKFEPINKHNKHPNGFPSSTSNPKPIIPLKLATTTANTNTTTTTTTTTNSTSSNLAKSAVVVNDKTTTSNGFTFPIVEDEPVSVKKMFFNVIAPDNNNQTEPNRDSLEVFQPRSHSSPRSRRISYEEDNVSDGSSDLFEIESFSTTTYSRQCDAIDEEAVSAHYNSSIKRFGMVCTNNDLGIKSTPPPLLLCRNSLDENEEPMTPSVAPTECYAPSEVSIDWSVTTAEGFDKASFTNFSVSASEIGYAAMRREAGRSGGGGGGGGKKSGGGYAGRGLLSCRCEKAVSVGPGPIKCPGEGGPPTAARHVGGGPPQQVGQSQAHASIVVGRSRTSRMGVPFAT